MDSWKACPRDVPSSVKRKGHHRVWKSDLVPFFQRILTKDKGYSFVTDFYCYPFHCRKDLQMFHKAIVLLRTPSHNTFPSGARQVGVYGIREVQGINEEETETLGGRVG